MPGLVGADQTYCLAGGGGFKQETLTECLPRAGFCPFTDDSVSIKHLLCAVAGNAPLTKTDEHPCFSGASGKKQCIFN